ncbi:MAG: MEDS domain-containing protein [Halanaerobiales bacterium]
MEIVESDILLNDLKKIKIGDHLVLLYRAEEDIISPLLSCVKESLKRNEKCLYITGESNTEDILSTFHKNIPDLDQYIKKGQRDSRV